MKHRPVVMVVEDDTQMNQLQREMPAVNGLDSVPACSGAEAMEVSARWRPDAVLLDLMLPEMDGIETCRRLRIRFGKNLPIVVVTALDDEACRREGLRAGAGEYFTKPFDPDQIVQAPLHLLDGVVQWDGR